MVCKYSIVVLFGILLTSCAQVGVISGGKFDREAPRPIEDKVVPLNESTNFQGNTVEIPFDEYFRLVNPTQNIRMVPPHATVVATVKKKTLTLTWEDTLESNTTYAIYLNDAIKDMTEGNDTVIQYVFSTGSVLDTLSYSVPVIDAWSSESADNCVVALYDADKLISFAKPENGIAKLNYLKSGTYTLVAFNDENNDLELQEYERIGFPETGKVVVNDSWFDSVPLRMFSPTPIPKFNKVNFYPPGAFIVSANFPFTENVDNIYVNGESVLQNTFYEHEKDSLEFYTNGRLTENRNEIVIESTFRGEKQWDTLSCRVLSDKFSAPIKVITGHKAILKPGFVPFFRVQSAITEINPDLIHLMNLDDSTEISPFEAFNLEGKINVYAEDSEVKNLMITLDEGAIQTLCGPSQKLETKMSFAEDREYGVLHVTLSDYSDHMILQLLQRGKVIDYVGIDNDGEIASFEDLSPGGYSFRVIHDLNNNGKWDVGDYSTLTQPELVDYYSKKTKVRANWTIDVTLTPIH